MTSYDQLLKNIEERVGLPIDEIREKSPGELREYLEKKNGKRFHFISKFPFIGRGNVIRNRILGREEINAKIDKILASS